MGKDPNRIDDLIENTNVYAEKQGININSISISFKIIMWGNNSQKLTLYEFVELDCCNCWVELQLQVEPTIVVETTVMPFYCSFELQ